MKKIAFSKKSIFILLLSFALLFSSLTVTAANESSLKAAVSTHENKHLSVTANDDGCDIYSPAKIFFTGVGYRYGPTIIKNDDGSRDIFLAAPGTSGEWDWIMQRHYDKDFNLVNAEKAVLQPTPGSDDFYSTCDPGVVFFGGYYYIGYTSTENPDGKFNNIFVARSRNVDGPYEKWNGSGWGGKPEMIVEYTEKEDSFGAGEPSLLVIGEKLYMYYTYASNYSDVKLAVADATDENWPKTLKEKAIIFKETPEGTDSVDVKYIDKYKKFIAICTAKRMTEDSSVDFYESTDGVNFSFASSLKTNVTWYCHNAGIEGNLSGHIEQPENVTIGYAYGKKWGAWSLRLQSIQITESDEIDLSDQNNSNVQQKNKFDWNFLRRDFTGITTAKRIYNVSQSDGEFKVKFKKVNRYTLKFPLHDDVIMSDYDEEIISINGKKITPLKSGSTLVTAEWNGNYTTFLVNVE